MQPHKWFRVRLSPYAKNIFSDSFYLAPKRKNAYQYVFVSIYSNKGVVEFPGVATFNAFLVTSRSILKMGAPGAKDEVSKLKFVMTPSITSSAMRVVGGRLGLSMLGLATAALNDADSTALDGMLQKLNVRV